MLLEDAEIEWRFKAFVLHLCLVCMDDGFDGIELGGFVVWRTQQSNDILGVFRRQFWNLVRLERNAGGRVSLIRSRSYKFTSSMATTSSSCGFGCDACSRDVCLRTTLSFDNRDRFSLSTVLDISVVHAFDVSVLQGRRRFRLPSSATADRQKQDNR